MPDAFEEALKARSRATGETIDVTSPMTGETIGTMQRGTEHDVEAAFETARKAQRTWAKTPIAERRSIFLRFHDLVYRHRELLMDVVQLETGKNRQSAYEEVLDVMANARYYGRNAAKFLVPERRGGAIPFLTRSTLYHHPKGIIGQIAPWNYPLTLGISDAIPALMAGNAVVAKPDENTPFCSLVAFELLAQAGLPEGLTCIVTGQGLVVGSAIADRCDHLMFTGSSATGAALGEQIGKRLISYSAELGGKNPLIILDGADVKEASKTAVKACFANSGQLCVSIERLYVEAGVADEFTKAFAERVNNMKIGASFDWNLDMGSLTGKDQLDTVTRFVDNAVEAGATVLAGGKARPDLGPYVFEPTLLTDVPDSADLHRDEVFGPVVYIERVSDAEKAIEEANDTCYGLNSAIFGPADRARELAPKIEAGTVGINDGYLAAWGSIDNPMGGWKTSGVGVRHGKEGIVKYTATQNVTEQRGISMQGPPGLSPKRAAAFMLGALKLGKSTGVMK